VPNRSHVVVAWVLTSHRLTAFLERAHVACHDLEQLLVGQAIASGCQWEHDADAVRSVVRGPMSQSRTF
jgi:hypothetical protein